MPLVVACLLLGGCAAVEPVDDIDGARERLAQHLETLAQQGFAGQVAVTHGDDIVILEGYGRMGVDDPRPVTADAVMPLASITKPLAASAVLALAAQGRLALDDPIGNHLHPLQSPWADITVEALLTHSAGLPAEIANRRWDGPPRFEPIDLETFLERVQHFRPEDQPGAGFNYSNLGYGLLTAVIEAASGRPWEDYLAEALLSPAGIDDIGLIRPDWKPDEIVRSRDGNREYPHHLEQPRLPDGMGWHLRGSGDLLARPGGVIAWWRAVRDGAWLPKPWLKSWLTPRVNESDGSRYGYGLHFRTTRLGEAIGHTGEDLGYSASLTYYPEHDLMVYINGADARFPADRLRDRIERFLAAP